MTWNPFAKKNSSDTTDGNAATKAGQTATKPKQTQGKGRPTPKMKDAQQRNLHPLVPKDRKAQSKEAKKRIRAREDAEYEAMRTGDITHMPKSERIPWRIYIRDYVDARFNLAEYFIPVVFLIMIVSMVLTVKAPQLSMILTILMYVYIVICIIDIVIMWFGLKKKLIAKYGEKSVGKGSRSCSYAWGRAIQLRRWRIPKPRAKKRGQWPK